MCLLPLAAAGGRVSVFAASALRSEPSACRFFALGAPGAGQEGPSPLYILMPSDIM